VFVNRCCEPGKSFKIRYFGSYVHTRMHMRISSVPLHHDRIDPGPGRRRINIINHGN
jgi:hypothetical protein